VPAVILCTLVMIGAVTAARRPPTSRTHRMLTTAVDACRRLSPSVPVSVPRLQRRVLRRMLETATEGLAGVLVPPGFVVQLAPADWARVRPAERWFGADLSAAFRLRAERHGWTCPVAVRVEFDVRSDLPAGTVVVSPWYASEHGRR
jgi:hypothetical protein